MKKKPPQKGHVCPSPCGRVKHLSGTHVGEWVAMKRNREETKQSIKAEAWNRALASHTTLSALAFQQIHSFPPALKVNENAMDMKRQFQARHGAIAQWSDAHPCLQSRGPGPDQLMAVVDI